MLVSSSSGKGYAVVITGSSIQNETEESVTLSWHRKLLRDASVGRAPGRKPKHTRYSVTFRWHGGIDKEAVCVFVSFCSYLFEDRFEV